LCIHAVAESSCRRQPAIITIQKLPMGEATATATGDAFSEATRAILREIAHVEVAGIAIASNLVAIFHLNVPASST
jgi:hypothetical protein